MSNLDIVHGLFGKTFRISRWYIPGHDGIDLPARRGTPIRAVASGRVSYAGDTRTLTPHAAGRYWGIGAGNLINIDIGGEMTTHYAHLDKVYVKSGETVRKGQIIGTVGSTGGMPHGPGANFGASNSHLHFGLWNRRTNKMVDPTRFLQAALAGWTNPTPDAPDRGNVLPGWGNLIKFPEGHILTDADVRSIIATLDAHGFFGAPVAGAISKGVAESVLLRFVGQPWTKDTQVAIQNAFNQSADEADDLGGAAAVLQPLADVAAAVLDPANWLRIIALFVGIALTGFGLFGVVRATGPARV